MSVKIYIGPYFDIDPNTELTVKTHDATSCPKCDCERYGGPYCSACGSKLEEIPVMVPVETAQAVFDYIENEGEGHYMGDAFVYPMDDVSTILIPNQFQYMESIWDVDAYTSDQIADSIEDRASLIKDGYAKWCTIFDEAGIKYTIKEGVVAFDD